MHPCSLIIQKEYKNEPIKMELRSTMDRKMTADAEGYRYSTRTTSDYLGSGHTIRLHCIAPDCPSFTCLLGRHSATRVEELFWLRSLNSHNHPPNMQVIDRIFVYQLTFMNSVTILVTKYKK
jgi:hypothetical protein